MKFRKREIVSTSIDKIDGIFEASFLMLKRIKANKKPRYIEIKIKHYLLLMFGTL